MTPAQLATLESMARDKSLLPSEQDAAKAAVAMREAVLSIAGPLAQPGVNTTTHLAMSRVLKAIGERA